MTIFSVYSYCWSLGNTLSYQLPDLKTAINVIGLTSATVAFLISDGTSTGIWPSFTQAIPDMVNFVNNGGDLAISVGGASGPFIQDYMDQNTMFTVLSNLINQTGCTRLDFDIEGASIAEPTGYNLINKVVNQLQQKNPNLKISYTIPVGQPIWGSITEDGLALIQNIIDNNVSNFIINGMLMDLYDHEEINWGAMSINIIENMKVQLSKFYPQKSDSEIYSMIGGTFMSGIQDDSNIFTVSDAITFSNYAMEKGIGLVGYWALQRDQIGTGSLVLYNGINSENFEFYNTISKIIDNSSRKTPGAISTPTQPGPPDFPPGPVDIPYPQWKVNVVYNIGDYVIYNNIVYKCIYPNKSIASWAPGIYTQSLWTKIM